MRDFFNWYIADTILFVLIILIIIVIAIYTYIFFMGSSAQFLEIDFFDVGQGDSFLIETVENKKVLVDLGRDNNLLPLLNQRLKQSEKIDAIILTHPDGDHIGNITEVIKQYQVGKIFYIKENNDNAEFLKLKKLLTEEGDSIEAIQPMLGDQLIIDCCTKIDFLWPVSENTIFTDNPNDNSISFVLNYNQFSFFGGGDLSLEFENRIGSAINILAQEDLDVIKIGHHGSKTSTDLKFLESIHPAHAIIQAGKNNSYGHPHQDVIKNLDTMNIEYLSNQDFGNIKLISDGVSYEIH